MNLKETFSDRELGHRIAIQNSSASLLSKVLLVSFSMILTQACTPSSQPIEFTSSDLQKAASVVTVSEESREPSSVDSSSSSIANPPLTSNADSAKDFASEEKSILEAEGDQAIGGAEYTCDHNLGLSCMACVADNGSNPPTAKYTVHNGGYDDLIDIVQSGSPIECQLARHADLRCHESHKTFGFFRKGSAELSVAPMEARVKPTEMARFGISQNNLVELGIVCKSITDTNHLVYSQKFEFQTPYLPVPSREESNCLITATTVEGQILSVNVKVRFAVREEDRD